MAWSEMNHMLMNLNKTREMIGFMLGECWYDGELGVSGHPPQQEADIKDQPRVSTQNKGWAVSISCLTCGKRSAHFLLRKAGSDWLQTEYGSSWSSARFAAMLTHSQVVVVQTKGCHLIHQYSLAVLLETPIQLLVSAKIECNYITAAQSM